VWTSLRLLRTEAPEPHVIRWISERLNPGGTFFDVGAHYGWMSLAAAKLVGSSGRVIAFEASPVLLDVLSYHRRVNRLNQIQIVSNAISDKDSDAVAFYLVNKGLSFRNSLTIGGEDTPYIMPSQKMRFEVRSMTLDRFCSESRVVPDLIKIDVEGAELLVLQGAERLIEEFHPALILGVHPYWLPRSQNVEQIFAFLERHRYRVHQKHVVEFEDSYLADYFCI
jgi:FkbM family methyltransferase